MLTHAGTKDCNTNVLWNSENTIDLNLRYRRESYPKTIDLYSLEENVSGKNAVIVVFK